MRVAIFELNTPGLQALEAFQKEAYITQMVPVEMYQQGRGIVRCLAVLYIPDIKDEAINDGGVYPTDSGGLPEKDSGGS